MKKINKKELISNIIAWAIGAGIMGWIGWQITNPNLWK